ncbi:hypothetical protein ACQKRQ_35135 [Paraburkholderia sp. NPDC080076]|jgi:hypothetical protein|uniref:hypothetical protein n=1 Tax=Paraburkholderia sp. NPDC080076 TaxID=3390605 RepID=UPI003D067801
MKSIQRYLNALETADHTQLAELKVKAIRLQDKIVRLRSRRTFHGDERKTAGDRN